MSIALFLFVLSCIATVELVLVGLGSTLVEIQYKTSKQKHHSWMYQTYRTGKCPPMYR